MEVYGNKFAGDLPSINCPMLEVLDLNNYHSFSNMLGYSFTGSIPEDMYLPKCKVLKLNHNQLTGEIPTLNMPSLQYLYLNYNKLTGGLGNIPELGSLIILDVSYNDLSGKLPGLIFPNMVSLSCQRNDFSDELPAVHAPKLKKLFLDGNSFEGEIPNYNLSDLEDLDISNNNLSGTIPDFSLPNLEVLDLGSNNLIGPLPNFNLPELRKLDLPHNSISGEIPNLSLPSLTRLDLRHNNFEGELPMFNLPELDEMRIDNNNLSGPVPNFNFPKVEDIYLNDNKLSGSIPEFDLPGLRYLYLNNNDLIGTFNNAKLPSLYNVSLKNNSISDLVQLKPNSPNLNGNVDVKQNSLTFEDIEPNMDLKYFYYEEQDSVEHFESPSGAKMILAINVGGTSNSYQWLKSTDGINYGEIPGAVTDSVEVPFEANASYTCRITNTIAPDLTLFSIKGIAPSCISFGVLEFCTETSEWEKGEEDNQIATNGKVIINDLLIFEGNVTIDTTILTMKADGEFYMENIPLPGGTQLGKYSFCKGEYELKLAGEEGAITDFLDSEFQELGQLFGIDLKVSKLELVGGRDATGIKLDCKIKIDGIAGSCGEGGNAETEVELSGLQFATTGISLDGIEITDLSMFIEGFCLKQLKFSYDSEKDILISGASVALPFGEIGGGFKLAQGYLDSIAWRIEASKPAFVIGTTTIGVKGCFGSISNITGNPLEVELGGIFSDITTENLYQLDISGLTKWPSVFGAKGSGKFFKPPFTDKPYQISGGVGLEYDFSENIFKVELEGKIGTNDEETWLIDGSGKLVVNHKNSPTNISGTIDGTMTLSELEDKFPYTWLNSMFSLPVKGNAFSALIYTNRLHQINGQATFQTETRGPYALRYVMNLDKAYGTPGHFYWDTSVETKSAQLKSGSIIGEFKEEVVIPEETEFAVIGISSPTQVPVSILTAPNGKIYTTTAEEDKVIYTHASDSADAFWTIGIPAKGAWNVALENPSENDSIFLFIKQPDPELEISMTQEGNNVKVNWDPTNFTADDRISIMLDDDHADFDGIVVADDWANIGEIEFEMTDSLSLCSYNLFAQVSNDYRTIQDYAEGTVNNMKAILVAPEIYAAVYNPETGKTTLDFEPSNDNTISGYILEVSNQDGVDSVYAVLNAWQSVVEITIEDHEDKAVRLTSFDVNGLTGCPSQAIGIHNTGRAELTGISSENEDLLFFPNPTTGRGTIKFAVSNRSQCDIFIADFSGRIIANPISERKDTGTYFEEWNFGDLPNGMYLLILRTNKGVITTKCILSK